MVKRVSQCILFSQILILGIVYFYSFDHSLDVQDYLPKNAIDLSAGFEETQLIKQNPDFKKFSETEWLRESEAYDTKLSFTQGELKTIELKFHTPEDLALYQDAHLNGPFTPAGQNTMQTRNGLLLNITQKEKVIVLHLFK